MARVRYLEDKNKPNISTIGCCLMASSHLDTAHFLRGIALLRLAFTLFTHISHASTILNGLYDKTWLIKGSII